MVVSVRESQVTGTTGVTAAEGISQAAASAISLTSDKFDLSHTDPANPKSFVMNDLAAAVGKLGGTAYPQQSQSANDALNAGYASAKIDKAKGQFIG